MTARPAQLRKLGDAAAFAGHLSGLGIDLAFDDSVDPGGALSFPVAVGQRTAGNRLCILPMEGWDAGDDGAPTDLVRRRWERFGRSGAKLIWGGEAVAVRPDGRANPRQLCVRERSVEELSTLRAALVAAHEDAHGGTGDLVIGLQLTHSGQWSRPDPRGAAELSDDELDELVGAYIAAGVMADRAGFDFVDIKHCHGYLLHELATSTDRPGRYGDDPGHFLAQVMTGLAGAAPSLDVAVRVSAYDDGPFARGDDGVGVARGGACDTSERIRQLLSVYVARGGRLVCVTAGSPYTNPHTQRPAFFPPSDGYLPPRDPLVDVTRMLDAAADVKARHSEVTVVGSGYSYLQEWLPHVAQAQVRTGRVDAVGYGRMALAYPGLAADILSGTPLDRRQICRTFSDCTTAPRHGLVSGCYPLDPFYKSRPERSELVEIKRRSVVRPR